MRTTTMRRLAQSVLAASVVVGAVAYDSRAEAQEIQMTGPLAGAPAVRGLRQYREGRFELAPTVSFTLLDEYRRTILVGGRINYNIKDWIAVGVWGGFGAISTSTDLTDQIDTQSPRNGRTAINVNHRADGSSAPFQDQVAKIQWVAAPQITFAPFRGKIGIFQKVFLDTDAYLHAGLAFVGLQERGDCGGGPNPCNDPKTFALASRVAPAPTFGLGLNFYTGDFLAVGVEYRALPFSWNRGGFDSRGGGNNKKFPDNKIDSDDQTFKFNQMITVSVSFSVLPTHPKISE